MTEVMLDTETLDTEPGAAILSIGAVVFDPLGSGHGEVFYRTIDLTSQLMLGFHVSPGTLEWWRKQEKSAQDALSVATAPIRQVLTEFDAWFTAVKGEKVWCHGATFDAPIVSKALSMIGLGTPWKYSNVRDTRTVLDWAKVDLTKDVQRVGTYHNALDDAIFQVAAVQLAAKRMLHPLPQPIPPGL